jgi:LPXTG-site transpeptidase (sortase) family protein
MPKLRYKKIVAISLLVIILVGGGVFWFWHEHTEETKKKTHVITYSPDKPDETKPNRATYKWYGQPDDPKYISLPTIKAEGFLLKVGVDQHNQVATPDNINMAGWFVKTVRPGQKGLSIIDGHVTGWVNNGIFKDLVKLKSGDTYSVEFGNGTHQEFKVKAVKNIPVTQAASVLFSQDPKVTNQLNLITCGGAFNYKTSQYENRIIVISEVV